MKKLLVLFLASVGFAFAATASTSGEIRGADLVMGLSVLAGVVGLGIAALGGGIGMGHAASAAISGTARNPALGSKLQTTMFIAIALIEAQVIYTLVFAVIAIYVNPYLAGL